MFKFDKCTYKLTKHKLSTARAYFLKKGVKFVYTVEASVGGYLDSDNKLVHFSIEKYEQMGKCLVEGLFETLRIGFTRADFVEGMFGKFKPELPATHPLMNTSLDMNTVLRDINKALEQGEEPEEEGGSDSESAEEDVGAKQKARLLDQLAKLVEMPFISNNADFPLQPIRKKNKKRAGTQLIRVKKSETVRIKAIPKPAPSITRTLSRAEDTLKALTATEQEQINMKNTEYSVRIPFGSGERRFPKTIPAKDTTEKPKLLPLSTFGSKIHRTQKDNFGTGSSSNQGLQEKGEKEKQVIPLDFRAQKIVSAKPSEIMKTPVQTPGHGQGSQATPIQGNDENSIMRTSQDNARTSRTHIVTRTRMAPRSDNFSAGSLGHTLVKAKEKDRLAVYLAANQPSQFVQKEVKVSNQLLDGAEFLRMLRVAQAKKEQAATALPDDSRRFKALPSVGQSNRRKVQASRW